MHEALVIPANYPIIKVSGLVEHYSYHSIEHYISKGNFYTSLGAEKMYHKGRRNYAFKMLVSPGFVFFKFYILKLGFLDGLGGYIAARLHMQTDFIKYAKLRELIKKQNND